MHPNRILSVTGLSVPHSFLGNDVKPTDLLKEIYKDNFFYILYFQEEGRAEKELEKDLEFSLRTLFSNSDFYGLSQMIKFQSTLNKKKNEGFLEAAYSEKLNKKVNFFHLGKKNNWKNLLDQEMEKKIREAFHNEMEELKYI